jgi:diguanylate cyclase (GGDEF)-like protein
MPHAGNAITLTVSIGVTEIKPDDSSADDTLARADRAQYQAKQKGRNRVVVEV